MNELQNIFPIRHSYLIPLAPLVGAALAPTPSQIGQCDFCLRNRAPKNPEIAAPISGSSGISQA